MGICIYLERDRRSASSLLVLLACGVLGCADAMGATPLPLPQAASNWLGSGSAQLQQGVNANQMIVNQLSQRAILNWQSFDIGKDNAVYFNNTERTSSCFSRSSDTTRTITTSSAPC